MSLALHKASRMIRVPDPRLDFSEQGVQVISDSATGLIYQKFTAASPASGGIITFNTFQQPTQAISTKMFIKTSFTITIDSGSDTAVGYVAGQGAPRQFPLHSVAQNARIQINGASNDIYPNQLVHAMMRYNNSVSELGRDLSPGLSFPDMYQEYNNGTVVVDGWDFPANTAYGSGNNALGQIGECSFDMEPRGGYPLTSVALSGTGNRKAIIKFTSIEPVLLPPLSWGHDNHKALIGVNTLNITYNLANIGRAWSTFGTGFVDPVITGEIDGNPELYCVLMTPKMIDKIEPVQIYPLHQIFPYQQTVQFPLGLAYPKVINSAYNAIQLSGVPKRIYIYAKRADETALTTDTFAGITSLNLQFDTVTGIFGGATQQQLYNVCAENGYNGSFADWAYYSGGIMCIDCEKDLPLNELLAVGSSKNITFSYTIGLQDITRPKATITADPGINYKLYTMVVYEGIFSIDQFNVPLIQLNTVTPQDIINAKEIQKVPYHAIKNFASGGSFSSQLSHLGSFARKLGRKAIGAYESLPDTTKSSIGNIVKDAATLVSPALSKAIEDFGPLAYDRAKALVGMGYSEDQIYELLAGAGLKKKKASKVSGGKKLTKAQLHKLAMG